MVFASTTASSRRHRLRVPRIRGPIAAATTGALVLVAGAAVVAALSSQAGAAATVSTLTPTTTAGATGGQPVKALPVKELSGATGAWDRSVAFGAKSTTVRPRTTPTTAPVRTTSAPPTPTSAPPTTMPAPLTPTPVTAAYVLPPANAVWDYQIGGPYSPVAAVGIVDRDHTEPPAAGKYNICYVNAYQTQPGASRAWPSAALLRTANGQLVEDAEWEGEYLVDTRSAASRTAIMSVLGPWIDSCADKGFRAVEVDNLDSYTRDPSRQLSEAGSVALAKLIVARAHSKRLAIGQKNTVELAATGKSQIGFDFAVVESCQRWDECDGYTDVYGTQVYEVEYVEEGGPANWRKACDARGSRISITYRDVLVKPAGSSGYTFKHC